MLIKISKWQAVWSFFVTFALVNRTFVFIMAKNLNRIKVMLAEKNKKNVWLAEQLGKDPATVSKWCTNTSQPGLETLIQIAKVLGVEVQDLIRTNAENEE